jgi:hypothetical protein
LRFQEEKREREEGEVEGGRRGRGERGGVIE